MITYSEKALQLILPDNCHNRIFPIITRHDFLNYELPGQLQDWGLYSVYKIHGSKKNCITNQNTASSLITTMSALGREREEGKTFAIEPFKKPALNNLVNKRTLIVMGYSGTDDFDIGPALHEIKNLKRLIWIDHSLNPQIEIDFAKAADNREEIELIGLTGIDKLLVELRSENDMEVIRIRTNTGYFIKAQLWNLLIGEIPSDIESTLNAEIEMPRFADWSAHLFENIPSLVKY